MARQDGRQAGRRMGWRERCDTADKRTRPEICRDHSVAGSSPATGTLDFLRLLKLILPACRRARSSWGNPIVASSISESKAGRYYSLCVSLNWRVADALKHSFGGCSGYKCIQCEQKEEEEEEEEREVEGEENVEGEEGKKEE
ncbi:hypothetical protein PoB_004759400 [Plakobranchus ocellatus]|uniref:Uncharacterized protein n=1 Tax=Plakobranchus ocellatus TaxID=259542 RepID=A0AAV4BRU7_9GAST|nr:hypothetical protein PoB_004759400 [Plakobranchus ocellatus]